jgi:type IV pilus assembly protein PilB
MKALLNPENEIKDSTAQPESAAEIGQHIANLLVRHGQITAEQLKYAIRIRSKLSSTKTLVSVLQELHFITAEKLQEVLKTNALSVPLGALLVELGYLRESDLRAALALQAEKPDRKLGEILAEAHLIKEDDLVDALSFQLGYERLSPDDYTPEPEYFRAAPVSWFRSKDCIPLMRREGAVVVAFADPRDQRQIDMVSKLFGDKIVAGIAKKDEIHHALNRIESANVKHTTRHAAENEIVQIANDLITQAADSSVSDIHIEPAKKALRVRFRKDGVLVKHKDYPFNVIGPLTNRIKIMSSIDISEKRRHQDGRILFDYCGNPLDIRVSTYGTIYGESIVMRLLNNCSISAISGWPLPLRTAM